MALGGCWTLPGSVWHVGLQSSKYTDCNRESSPCRCHRILWHICFLVPLHAQKGAQTRDTCTRAAHIVWHAHMLTPCAMFIAFLWSEASVNVRSESYNAAKHIQQRPSGAVANIQCCHLAMQQTCLLPRTAASNHCSQLLSWYTIGTQSHK